jgi:hypothetical protein
VRLAVRVDLQPPGWHRLVVRLALWLVLVLCAAAAAASASSAQSVATRGFTGSYVPFNPWLNQCLGTGGVIGREPEAPSRYPVFVYLTGTGGVYDGTEPTIFLNEMARRGFVAASVEYDTLVGVGPQALDAKSGCIFDGGRATSAVAGLCARARADCTRGILVAGFSQGAYIAARSQNHERQVRGVYALGLNDLVVPPDHFAVTSPPPTGIRSLPSSRLRIVNGSGWSDEQADQEGMREQLNALTGSSCGLTANRCLSASGSGWYIVQDAEVTDGEADHCYFHGSGECSFAPTFEPAWRPPASAPWSLRSNLDWLAAQLAKPALPATVNGLRGTYFNNADLTQPVLSRVDASVDYGWGSASPDPAIEKDTFSVRWTGTLQAPTTETYRLSTQADDGVRLWIDDRLLIDEWTDRTLIENSASLPLTAGRRYRVRMEYYDGSGEATARLLWSTPTILRQAIPRSWLFPGPAEPFSDGGQPGTGAARRTGAGARLRIPRTRVRGRKVAVRVTCAMACYGTLSVRARRGRRYATLENVQMAAGTRTVRVAVHRVLLRRARRKALRLRAVARVVQGGELVIARRNFSLRVRR